MAAKRRIGVLPEGLRLFERLTGRELLHYTGALRDMPADVVHARAAELLHVLDLESAAGVLVVDYSTGMRKKIALAAALLHAPRVLFLDEPFEGVDPASARVVRAILTSYAASGATVVFSSHVMELVEKLCDHVAVMHRGHVVAQGRLDDVRRGRTLEEAFLASVDAREVGTGSLSWSAASSG